jgi:hypothetical protein
MKQGKFLSDEQLVEQAIDVLMDKLGPIETMRFLSLPAKKRVDSVKRHHKWQATLDKERFFDEVFVS